MHADASTLSTSGSAFSSISLPHCSPFASPLENLSETALRACCYSAEVAVSGSPQLPGGERKNRQRRREEREEEEEKRGIRGKCVLRVYTASPLCIQECDCSILWALWCVFRQETQVLHSHSLSAVDDWRAVKDSSQVCRQWLRCGLPSSSTPTLQRQLQKRRKCAQTFTSAGWKRKKWNLLNAAPQRVLNNQTVVWMSVSLNYPNRNTCLPKPYNVWHSAKDWNWISASREIYWRSHVRF